MSLIRLTVLAVACAGASTALLIACVGDDATPVVTEPTPDAGTTTPVNSGGSSTSSSGSSGTTEPDASTTEPDASTTGPDASTDSGVTASPACVDYCDAYMTACTFQLADPESYPSSDVCLAICALLPVNGTTIDSLACRKSHLAADAGHPDCSAAGPWGFDADTSVICGATNDDQPYTAICRAASPRCEAAGAAITNCLSLADLADQNNGSVIARQCLERATFVTYTPGSTSEVVAGCNDLSACAKPNN